MPPIFYTEVRNKSIDYINNQPTGKARVRVTRYYTEFNPNPDSVLQVLDRWRDYEQSRTRLGKLKPISIAVEPGTWDLRLDWREEWEELQDADVPCETILGVTLYNVKKTRDLGVDRVREIQLGARVWGLPVECAAYYQKLGRARGTTSIEGTALGRVDYGDLLANVKTDTNIVNLRTVYSRATNTTAVMIRMEDDDA